MAVDPDIKSVPSALITFVLQVLPPAIRMLQHCLYRWCFLHQGALPALYTHWEVVYSVTSERNSLADNQGGGAAAALVQWWC